MRPHSKVAPAWNPGLFTLNPTGPPELEGVRRKGTTLGLRCRVRRVGQHEEVPQ